MSGSDTPRVDAIVESPMPLTAANIIMAKDELVRLARHIERELAEYKAGFAAANERADLAIRELAQSQARCAEVEKALATVATQIINLPRSATANAIYEVVNAVLKESR